MGKRMNRRQTMNNIPEEIIEGILQKLPVKSLLRFKCVSKAWISLISSKAFIEEQLKQSIAKDECNMLLFTFEDVTINLLRVGSSSLCDEPIITPNVINYEDYNIPDEGVCFKIVGSCNGLILVNMRNLLIYWNPSTRKVIKEFKPPSLDDGTKTKLSDLEYGFGYDESNDEYKVVCIESNYSPPYTYKAHMYTDSWKKIENLDKGNMGILRSAKFVNGRFHWLGGRRNVVSLDLSEEKFENVIATPRQCSSHRDDDRCTIKKLEVLGGYLCLCSFEAPTLNINVWAMKEYGVTESWTKIWSISDFVDLPVKAPRHYLTYPLSLKKNGDIAMAFGSGDIVVYNGKRELRKSRVHMLEDRVDFVVYVESLVS